MNALTLTLRPTAASDRASADPSPAREETRLVESVYRIVTALRADPRWTAEALPPDAYLAAIDSFATPHVAERPLNECSRRIEPGSQKEPQP